MAVTDSTGQHGPWSDQLTVSYDGMYLTICIFVITLLFTVPGFVIYFTAKLDLTNIIVMWQV